MTVHDWPDTSGHRKLFQGAGLPIYDTQQHADVSVVSTVDIVGCFWVHRRLLGCPKPCRFCIYFTCGHPGLLRGTEASNVKPTGCQFAFTSPVDVVDGVKLLPPLLLSLTLGFPPSLLSSSPVLLPLRLPLGQLGLPFALHLPQSALPLLLCLRCLVLLCLDCFTHFAFPVPAMRVTLHRFASPMLGPYQVWSNPVPVTRTAFS